MAKTRAKRDIFYSVKDSTKTTRVPLNLKDTRKSFALIQEDYNDPKHFKVLSYHRTRDKAGIAWAKRTIKRSVRK